jgi:FkbM family methyltransferase
MTVVLPEIISRQLYVYGLFDELATGMALRAVRQGDVVLDVGAHFGYFTLLFSRLVGESGRIVSLEPTPSTFAVLQRNTANLSNVTRLKVAAGRHNGSLTISDFGLTHSAWNRVSVSSRLPAHVAQPKARVEVAVIRLDDWCERKGIHPTLIKIDAENFETEVIDGLAETLARSHPRILMKTGSAQAVRAGKALMDLGYQVFVSTRPGVLTLQKDCVEEALMRHKDVLFVHGPQMTEFLDYAGTPP